MHLHARNILVKLEVPSARTTFKEHITHFKCNRFVISLVLPNIGTLKISHKIKVDNLKLLKVSNNMESKSYERFLLFIYVGLTKLF